jgi:predicted GIY-YIG superfamily endonuclease
LSQALQDYGLAGQTDETISLCLHSRQRNGRHEALRTGITHDLFGRLEEHNRGHCPHTAKYKPWRIETAVAFASEEKARAFEKYLKSGSGREFARRHF